MRTRALARTVAISTVLVLVMAACGNSGDDDDDAGGSSGNTTATTSGETDYTENVPVRRARRHRHRDPGVGHRVEDEPDEREVRRARRRHERVLRHGQRRRRHLRPAAEDHEGARRRHRSPEPGAGAGEPRRGQRVRDVRRDAAVQRRRRARRGRSADVHLEHQPGDGRTRQHLRQLGRDLLRLRRADRSLHRQAAGRHEGRRPRLRRRQSVEAVRAGHQGLVREVPDGRGRVLRRHDRVRRAEPQRPGRADEGEGRRLRRDLHGHQRGDRARQGDAEAGPRRDPAAAERLRHRPDRGQRGSARGLDRRPAVRRVRAGAADPRDQDVPRPDGEDRQGAGRGRDGRLDPRRPVRHRPEARRTRVLAAEGHRRAEHAHRLQRQRLRSARSTGPRSTTTR